MSNIGIYSEIGNWKHKWFQLLVPLQKKVALEVIKCCVLNSQGL
jgi:hypothetical protein